MKNTMGCAVMMALLLNTNVMAEEDQSLNFYVGGSAAINRLNQVTAYGFQGFVGYDFKDNITITNYVNMAAELGYVASGEWNSKNTGKFDAKGIWLAALFSIDLNESLSIINRLGYTFAEYDPEPVFFNADGIIIGLGADYDINNHLSVRAEIVMQTYKSYQLGGIYHF